jgi:hypothetical protein
VAHAARTEAIAIYLYSEDLEGRHYFGDQCVDEDNIKIDLQEILCETVDEFICLRAVISNGLLRIRQ